ncbi:MAG TPA: type II toxin-antitoxin system VapC family toxin [Pirellulales bacterium]|nr:type II toxin-antitoxin system VapC family toxin [Pirellulales bacterium]
MSFLLDTNTCSEHLRRPAGLIHRFVQHAGRLYLPTIVLGELYAWAYRRPNPTPLLTAIETELLTDVIVISYDEACALEFGRLRGTLLKQGISVSPVDLMIASVALVHQLTLVTHNTADFQHIPSLHLDDWLTP